MQLDPGTLPDLPALRQRAMALAMLDAILCPQADYRYFNFDPAWGDHAQLASMRNGEGDDWFVCFGAGGAVIKGRAHQLPRDDARALSREARRRLPPALAGLLDAPALSIDAIDYCFWRAAGEARWSRVSHPLPARAQRYDGSADFLSILLAPAECYQDYASDYFESDVALAPIEQIYNHAPLTAPLVAALNPRLDLAEARASAASIGYPMLACRLTSGTAPAGRTRGPVAASRSAAPFPAPGSVRAHRH
jgi:hypothetical protein